MFLMMNESLKAGTQILENVIKQVYRFKAIKVPFFVLWMYFIFMTSGHSIAQEEETEGFANFIPETILKINQLEREVIPTDSVNQFSLFLNDSNLENKTPDNVGSFFPGETLGWGSFSKVLP